jgi:predicted 3-demethylubiquinone-9 3-methyltransferase (glyoxalase superfamily)
MQNKIIPSLWFSEGGSMSGIVSYYQTIFGDDFKVGAISDLGDTPSGKTEICQPTIFGQSYSFMSTEKAHEAFNDSLALTIECEDQAEIDKYWNYFIKEGREVQCGWCVDKYGLRWQVIPKNLGELLQNNNGWEVMMKQKKIVIAEYQG